MYRIVEISFCSENVISELLQFGLVIEFLSSWVKIKTQTTATKLIMFFQIQEGDVFTFEM